MKDRELFFAWRDGDKSAGSELFSRHFDEVFRFFRNKVKHAEVAEDLVQQTFLACVRNRNNFRGDASFRTYLFQVARSRLYDHYRRRGRAPETVQTISRLHDPSPSPSSHLRHHEDRTAVRAAMARLGPEHRLTLELYYLHGFRGAELARVLDVPEGTARSRLRRARAQLARHMRRRDLG